MKTQVEVHFNGATMVYFFDLDYKTFMKKWDNQIPAAGFFSHNDENGNFIVINPNHCGAIEFVELAVSK